jgi:ABC-type Zn2+ transport system substrate-binding protein/surface adhesin
MALTLCSVPIWCLQVLESILPARSPLPPLPSDAEEVIAEVHDVVRHGPKPVHARAHDSDDEHHHHYHEDEDEDEDEDYYGGDGGDDDDDEYYDHQHRGGPSVQCAHQ